MDQDMSEPWLVCKVQTSKVHNYYLVTVNHQSDGLR